MTADDSLVQFGATFRTFLERSLAASDRSDPPLRARLREHFGVDPVNLAVLSEQFQAYDHPNVQLAIDAWLVDGVRLASLVGVRVQQHGQGLADLVLPAPAGLTFSPPAAEGPVARVNVRLGDGEGVLSCVDHGLYLVHDGDEPVALFIRGAREPFNQMVMVEVMAAAEAAAQRVLGGIRRSIGERNVYRGRVLSIDVKPPYGNVEVLFHHLPAVERDAIVLPEGVLDRVERHVIGTAAHAERLRQAGRHVKRGLLLHGPPGTGKTLTAMYLAGRMPDRTVLLVTGRGIGLVERSAAMARTLQPAMLVVEDVDLVAEERTRQGTGANSILFELLNQMDGLADDADVVFLLTTNRTELLEPALAARPGRVDLAVRVPLPDAASRARLIELYGKGLELRLDDFAGVVQRTEGVSPAFIKELLRKAAVCAAEEDTTGDRIAVRDRHVARALDELVVDGGDLTQALLGVPPTARRSC